jgi:hypothetical protein
MERWEVNMSIAGDSRGAVQGGHDGSNSRNSSLYTSTLGTFAP